MSTRQKVWLTVALFIGVLMYGGNPVLAAVLLVDDDKVQCPLATFTSIQAAVTVAAAGDTINVCPGNYTAVTIPAGKNGLILNGGFLPPVGPLFLPASLPAFNRLSCLDPFDPLNNSLQHSVVHGAPGPAGIGGTPGFTVRANNVTISNFTVEGAGENAGVNLARANSAHHVRGNVIQNNTFGVYFNSNGATPSDVSGNCIRNNNVAGAASGNGVYSDQGLSNAVIGQNIFTGHENASIIMVGGPAAATSQSNLQISNNEIVEDAPIILINTTASSITGNSSDDSAGSGIFFGGNVDHVAVTANFIESCAFTGINLRTSFVNVPNSNNTIAGNEVERCGDAGIRVRDGSHHNTLTDNEVNRSGAEGIGLRDGAHHNTVSENHSQRNAGDGILLAEIPIADGGSALGATDNIVSNNHSDRNVRDGLHADVKSIRNTIRGNRMREHFAPFFDCHDETGITATNVQNTWLADIGTRSSPQGICQPKR